MVVPPIVSDSIFTNLHFLSARLTRALYSLKTDAFSFVYNFAYCNVLVHPPRVEVRQNGGAEQTGERLDLSEH